ncbi:MAG: hypothetical protein EBZ59_07190 [Planctomycetia bacterium]|nr:hypothetical protein [Planctomycetia bacterium]
MTLIHTGQPARALETSRTASTLTLADGRATVAGLVAAGAAVISLGAERQEQKKGGARVWPIGTFSSSNGNIQGQVAIFYRQDGVSATSPFQENVNGILHVIGTYTGALGTSPGAAGEMITDTERFAQTLTFTPSADGTTIWAARGGTPQTFSPGSNGVGFIDLPELGGAHDLVILPAVGSSSAAADSNALVQIGG